MGRVAAVGERRAEHGGGVRMGFEGGDHPTSV
jgi:hypothetical protein